MQVQKDAIGFERLYRIKKYFGIVNRKHLKCGGRQHEFVKL